MPSVVRSELQVCPKNTPPPNLNDGVLGSEVPNSDKESAHTQGESLAPQGHGTPMLTEASGENMSGKEKENMKFVDIGKGGLK